MNDEQLRAIALAKARARMASAPVDNNEVDFSATEMVGNIPSSAANLAKNIYQAVRHPITTAETIGKTAAGGLYKANALLKQSMPESLSFMAKPIGGGDKVFGSEQEPYADAVKTAMIDRYGSADALKKTIEQDPVGFAADLAALTTGAGVITKSPTISNIGAAINPINTTINAAKYVAGKAVPKGLPSKLYESAAKFSTTIPEKERAAMVATALREKMMPTSKGVAKLEEEISGLNSKIDGMINTAQSQGKSVPKQSIYKYLKDLRQKKGGVRLDAPRDLNAINQIIGEFDRHLKSLGKDNLTPKDLQKLKVDAYKSINWDAKRMTGTPIKEDTYKTVARGAKSNIEDLVPGVKDTNKYLGDLYELQPHLQRAANRIENRDVISLGAPAKIGAGTMIDPVVGTAAGVTSALLDLPKVKSFNAIQLEALRKGANINQFINNNPNISAAELVAALSGRATEENQQGMPQ